MSDEQRAAEDRGGEIPAEPADEAQDQDAGKKLRSERLFSGLTLPLMALTIPLAVWGVLRTAADPDDHGLFTAFLLMATPVIPVAWAVLRVLGGKEPPRSPATVSLLRVVVIPLVAAWPPAIAVAIAVHVPAVQTRILETRGDDGWRYFFGEREGALLEQAVVLTGLAGLVFGMLAALALWVAVVFPVLSWRRPMTVAGENMLDVESAEGRAAAPASARLFSLVILLVFLIPTFMVVGSELSSARSRGEAVANAARFFAEPRDYWPDLMWSIGALLIPVGILVLVRLKRVQRPDRELRAKYRMNAYDDGQSGER